MINSYQIVLASQGNRSKTDEEKPDVGASGWTVKNRSFHRSSLLFSFSFSFFFLGSVYVYPVTCHFEAEAENDQQKMLDERAVVSGTLHDKCTL